MITRFTSSAWVPHSPAPTAPDEGGAPGAEADIGSSVAGICTEFGCGDACCDPSGYIAREHIDPLWSAVRERLCAAVTTPKAGAPLDALGGHPPPMLWARMQINVLECVSALDQLQSNVRHQMDALQQVELDLISAQAALAELRAQSLGGTPRQSDAQA